MSQGQNSLFISDPLRYCQTTCINASTPPHNRYDDNFNPNLRYQSMYANLKPWHSHAVLWKLRRKILSQVLFRPRPMHTSGTPIHGYWVPYVQAGIAAREGLKILQIPRHPGDTRRFVFTGGMNGCSLLLCERAGDAANYYVVHYPNSEGRSQLYRLLGPYYTIIMDLHFGIYMTSYEVKHYADDVPVIGGSTVYNELGNAFIFLYYEGGEWTAIVQRQVDMGVDAQRGVKNLVLRDATQYNIGDVEVASPQQSFAKPLDQIFP